MSCTFIPTPCAVPYHQQYLLKVPNGCRPDHSTRRGCPITFTAPVKVES